MTLSTTIWSFKVDEQASILLTDTVGFINRLPTYMIDAFESTLEESLGADLILPLVVDSSEDLENFRIKYSSCCKVLEQLKVYAAKVLVVLTKYDKATAQKIHEITMGLHSLRTQ
ncbi:MAG TPA: hypothetical protein VE692_07105 [Nitrososphaera sp.]|nr:hypothetical protein [Nitrososphaera sp.]